MISCAGVTGSVGITCHDQLHVMISNAVYYSKNDLVASEQRVNKEQYMKNEVK